MSCLVILRVFTLSCSVIVSFFYLVLFGDYDEFYLVGLEATKKRAGDKISGESEVVIMIFTHLLTCLFNSKIIG